MHKVCTAPNSLRMPAFFPWWGQGFWERMCIWVRKVRREILEMVRGLCLCTSQRDFAVKMFPDYSKVRTRAFSKKLEEKLSLGDLIQKLAKAGQAEQLPESVTAARRMLSTSLLPSWRPA